MRNKRFQLECTKCMTALEDNEAYDFRVQMFKTEASWIWVFVDDNVDLSGMICQCKDGGGENWVVEEIPSGITMPGIPSDEPAKLESDDKPIGPGDAKARGWKDEVG